MWIGVVTLFPEMFAALTEHGITGRAVKRQMVQVQFWNPRDFTSDRHRTVDDRPYGGGPGMLMKSEPLALAIAAARREHPDARVVYLSPQGRPLDQGRVETLGHTGEVILLCGRYEGIDERLVAELVDEEISLGDFVLSGGELAAMAVMDAMIRLQPGALGDEQSAVEDSFTDGLLDCPHYTRPEVVDGQQVPEVLLSGDHARIRQWRLQQSLGRTWERRPDLLEKRGLSPEEQKLLADYQAQQASEE